MLELQDSFWWMPIPKKRNIVEILKEHPRAITARTRMCDIERRRRERVCRVVETRSAADTISGIKSCGSAKEGDKPRHEVEMMRPASPINR